MTDNRKPIISAIVAMGENRVIGKDNQLPWRLPADLKHFKQLTIGNAILMGRKTYESIGRPLPNRINLIISRNPHYVAEGCTVVSSFEEALQKATIEKCRELFIIGGSEIYQLLLPYTERLYLTIVHHLFAGDAYFPELNKTEWKEIERADLAADTENAYSYSFLMLARVHGAG